VFIDSKVPLSAFLDAYEAPLLPDGDMIDRAADLINGAEISAIALAVSLVGTKLLIGTDPGWRGNLTGELHVDGTAESAQVKTRLRAEGVHRAEFAPAVPQDFDANCGFLYHYSSRALENLNCDSPLGNGRIHLTGVLPAEGAPSHLSFELAKVPVQVALDAIRTVRSGAHGAAMHHELELLVRAGLTPIEALRAATSTPAAVFHLDDRGVIRAGARADLLLVTGDPTAGIAATRHIAGVWKAGIAAAPPTEAAPLALASGNVSDFEDGTTKAAFGFGWLVSADKLAGGKSEAEIKVVAGGANGSKHSLLVEGEIRAGFVYPFAGAAFYPGAKLMQPANLSSAKSIRFWAKGDGKTYRVMVYTRAGGYVPGMQTFAAGPEWAEYAFPLPAFNGTDGRDITSITFAAGPQPQKFSFQIDDVRLR